jgi:hypothetical protein
MKHLKYFESIRDEFADMFAPRKPEDEPQEVPGFEGGTIDPDDDCWRDDKTSDKDVYQDFLKVTKERNFQETEDEIIINIKRLWEDFLMTIYNSKKHYKKFLRGELVDRYVSKGYKDIMTDEPYEGIIRFVGFFFDGDSCFVEFQLKDHKKIKNGFVEKFITIDKLKSEANKYNL